MHDLVLPLNDRGNKKFLFKSKEQGEELNV